MLWFGRIVGAILTAVWCILSMLQIFFSEPEYNICMVHEERAEAERIHGRSRSASVVPSGMFLFHFLFFCHDNIAVIPGAGAVCFKPCACVRLCLSVLLFPVARVSWRCRCEFSLHPSTCNVERGCLVPS